MDSSPKSSKKNNTTTDSPSSNPVEIQDSQIFTYLGNLSPIKPCKGVPAPNGFPGLNSPPLVFTSPTINSSSVSDLLKRPQLSGTGLSGKDEKFKEAVIVVGECGISNPQSSSGLTPCFQNAHPNDNSLPEKASSVSASSDDFLTNTVNMDCSAFTNSGVIPRPVDSLVDSAVSEVKHKYQDDNGKDEMITGISPLIKVKNDNGKDEMATGASPLISEQAEEMQVKSLSDLKPAEAAEKLGGGNAPSEPHPTVEPNSHTDCAFNNQSSRCSTAEIAGADNEAELGCSSQLGSLHNVEQGNCGENSVVQYTEAGPETMQHDHILKVGPQQHGVRRRCLQFEDAQRKTIEKSVSAHNLSGSTGFPSSSSSLEVLESSSRDKPAIPGTGLLANVIKPTFSSQHSGNYTMKVPKPSGIGLHLNSIVNAMQIGSGATVSLKSVERGSLSILGKKSSSTMSFHSSKNSSISLNQAEIVSVSSEDCKHDNVDSTAASRTPSLSDMVKHMNEYLPFKPIQLQSNLCDKRKSSSENANSIDDSSPSSPKKKRKKTLDTDDNDGCKRCNCKKTKCLKLYCECFAAGIYCADPCSCQGCFNRPEYEDTVLETRQQIESRNPQAFAPKVVPHINEPSSSSCGDDEIRYTPPSARHKKGCNCKKSKCSKKYCECFQSNVGCCDGCRCEGCENGHGRKGDYGMVRNQVSKDDYDEILDGSYDKRGLVARGDNLPHNELCNPQNLTPSTPSIQCSNHGKNASKSWISSERYLPSPESGLNFLSPYGTSPGLILNPDNQGVILEANDDTMDLVAFDQNIEYGSGDTMNHFPPRFDGPTLPNPQNSENMLRIQMLSGNHQVSHASSLRWRSSSVSPMTHFGGTDLFEVGNGGSYVMLNDDTPEVLKETTTPVHVVKVSSPNKKRVSPPHGHGSVISSGSSAGLKSGRKFILRSVPSFPPLTPCIDSKVHAGQNVKDSKDCSRG